MRRCGLGRGPPGNGPGGRNMTSARASSPATRHPRKSSKEGPPGGAKRAPTPGGGLHHESQIGRTGAGAPRITAPGSPPTPNGEPKVLGRCSQSVILITQRAPCGHPYSGAGVLLFHRGGSVEGRQDARADAVPRRSVHRDARRRAARSGARRGARAARRARRRRRGRPVAGTAHRVAAAAARSAARGAQTARLRGVRPPEAEPVGLENEPDP